MSSADPARATPIALIDLGDTLADCTPALQARLAAMAGSEERRAGEAPAALAAQVDRWRSAILAAPGFWRGLSARPQGMALLEMLRGAGFAVHVVTKGTVRGAAGLGRQGRMVPSPRPRRSRRRLRRQVARPWSRPGRRLASLRRALAAPVA
jgi:hypothetical protein